MNKRFREWVSNLDLFDIRAHVLLHVSCAEEIGLNLQLILKIDTILIKAPIFRTLLNNSKVYL